MKILLGCLNANGVGGSELYHYELTRALQAEGHDVTLFTLREINPSDIVRVNLQVRQLDLTNFDPNEKYDIIVASQPQVNLFILDTFKDTPIVSIIHSEIRSEDPILDPRISHYIAIRKPIVDMLINEYKIPSNKVSLIYNPIDTTRFNTRGDVKKLDRYSGIFVGEVLDPIRFKAVQHLVQQCIDHDWDLYLMSDSRYDFNHPNIKYLDKRWDTENIVKQMHFTAGILLGRTTLEGWCCGVSGYMYIIDIYGNIQRIETDAPDYIAMLCDSIYVAKQHLNLYKTLI